LDAPYRAGRGSTWLKIKALGREEFVVVGFTDSEKSRIGFGGLLLGHYAESTGIPAGVHWVRPEIVVETSFSEWTRDGILRHPSELIPTFGADA
jgi:bifunctional non-homologous end joining protein LigD